MCASATGGLTWFPFSSFEGEIVSVEMPSEEPSPLSCDAPPLASCSHRPQYVAPSLSFCLYGYSWQITSQVLGGLPHFAFSIGVLEYPYREGTAYRIFVLIVLGARRHDSTF